MGNGLEGGPPGEVIGDDGRVGTAVVALGDGPEALLACGVPHLHLEMGRKGMASGVPTPDGNLFTKSSAKDSFLGLTSRYPNSGGLG